MNHTAALVSMATSVPPHQFHQKQILEAAHAILAHRYPQFETLSSLFANATGSSRSSGISNRAVGPNA
jgi:alkylresorcinol/alkylpyrone synthase